MDRRRGKVIMTAPGVLRVESVASYARRVGSDVRLVLHLPDAAEMAGQPVVRFRDGDKLVRSRATTRPGVEGVVVEAAVPAKKLGQGVWRLSFRPGPDAAAVRLQARLLTSRTQPVALLTGPVPRTVLAPPRPRASRAGGPAHTSRGWRAAASAVDRALGPLPDERAARYRAALVRVARRLPARS